MRSIDIVYVLSNVLQIKKVQRDFLKKDNPDGCLKVALLDSQIELLESIIAEMFAGGFIV